MYVCVGQSSYRLLDRLADVNYNWTVFMPQQIILAQVSMNEVALMVHPERIRILFFIFSI